MWVRFPAIVSMAAKFSKMRGEARRRFESPRKQAFINPKNLLEDLFKFLGFSVMSVTAVGDTNTKNIISAQKYGRSHLFNTSMVQKKSNTMMVKKKNRETLSETTNQSKEKITKTATGL